MSSMFYLKKGFQKSLNGFRKHKIFWSLMILLQIILILSIIAVSAFFQLKIYKNIMMIMQPLEDANYDSQQLQEGMPFVENPELIMQSFELLKKNLSNMLIWIIFMIFVGNGLLWLGTSWLLGLIRNKKELIKASAKYAFTFTTYMIIIGAIGYYLLSRALLLENEQQLLNYLRNITYLGGMLYYFVLTAFSMIATISWKIFFGRIYELSIRNIHKTILTVIISLTAIFLPSYALYLSLKQELLILALPILLIVAVVMVFTRSFLTCSLYLLLDGENGENHP